MRAQFEEKHGSDLDTASKNLKLLWIAWGKTDIANENSKAMLKLFDKYGVKYMDKETPGGHTWNNWRKYLYGFAQRLFK